MRALISVYDKTGVVELARGLHEMGVELVSTGGTEALLRGNGVAVRGVQELTGFPEVLGGRVKTLHPALHAGILAVRDNPAHGEELAHHGFGAIDLVIANLYPFLETVQSGEVNLSTALEQIDIGGNTLLRAAAKNFASVLAVSDPRDYPLVLEALREPGGASRELRRSLAAKAFQHCALYDTTVAQYLRSEGERFPDELTVAMRKVTSLRYGENPHQQAAFYQEVNVLRPLVGVVGAEQLHGKQLSYNNTFDLDAAWRIVGDFSAPTVAIVKHGNPAGLACGDDIVETYRRALATDPQAAFGGAVGVNRQVDEALAEEILGVFFEDLIAPSFTEDALAILRRKRDLRVLATGHVPAPRAEGDPEPPGLDMKRVLGGMLVQTWDALPETKVQREVVTVRQPTLAELTSLIFAWRAVKHVRSNAIVLAKGLSLVGVGAGQMSRVDSVDLACRKAGERASGSVMASDAFFPFPDGIERAAEAGITAVVQPGGSIRDQEVIKAANRHGIAMIFAHQRHFFH